MSKIPVLAIGSFVDSKKPAYFYASRLSVHLAEKHALISHPHKHDFYLTVFFSAGRGMHEVDFSRYKVEPGSVFVLKPGQIHYWELSPDTEGYIFFHSDFSELRQAEDFPFFTSGSSPQIKPGNQSLLLFENQFASIYDEFRETRLFRERKLANLVDSLYIDLSRIYEPEAGFVPHRHAERIRRLEKLVEEHYKTEKSPAQYAAWMHITPKHLNRIVREALNVTTGELIARRVVLEARRLISHSSSTLSETGRELGFEEYAYFSRFFKKMTGESLSQFRKKYRET